MGLSPTEKETLHHYYTTRAARFSDPAAQCGWISPFTQTLRFQAVTTGCDLSSATLLDVGCGYADLFSFLQQDYENIRYTGLDLLPQFVDAAQTRHPEATCIAADFFEYTATPYDYVFAVGAFNHRVQDNRHLLAMALRKMFEMAKVCVGVSLLSDLSPAELKRAKSLFYYSPAEVFQMATAITPFVELKTHYLPNDMTIVLYK